jgi:hypothetical protein
VLLLAILASAGCPRSGGETKVARAASAGFVGPDAFVGNVATIQLPRTGATIVIVPDLTIADQDGELRASLTVIDQAPRVTPLRSFPPATTSRPAALPTPLDSGSAPPAPRRTFALYDQATQQYVTAVGNLVFTSAAYAFYEEPASSEPFSTGDYQALARVVDRHLPELEQVFGSATDLDGNDKIAVFISNTNASRHPAGEAHVDGCNLSDADCTTGTPRGEIVYFWDPASIRAARGGTLRDLARDYFARNILHETIHLLQASHRIRRAGLASEPWSVPGYIVEGQAELSRFLFALDLDDKYGKISRDLNARRGPEQAPYQAGSLVFLWLHRYFGAGVHQAFLDGLVANSEDDAVDPFIEATRVPEPLLIGMVFAAVYGRLDGLVDVEAARLELTPPTPLSAGGRIDARSIYTQPTIVRVSSAALVRVEVLSKVRAWVIVVPSQGG